MSSCMHCLLPGYVLLFSVNACVHVMALCTVEFEWWLSIRFLRALHRCWNYSTRVGQDTEHPQLCERCLPVIRGMGFELPPSNGVAAPAEAAAVPS